MRRQVEDLGMRAAEAEAERAARESATEAVADSICAALARWLAPPGSTAASETAVTDSKAVPLNSSEAQIPPNAYLQKALREPPYVVAPDYFLFLPTGKYLFSVARIGEAKRQCWALVRLLVEQGRCDRLVVTSGSPGAGKSTWIEQHASAEGSRTVFFDDLLNNRLRRQRFLAELAKHRIRVEVEVVVVYRDFEQTLLSVQARQAAGGHGVPEAVMRKFFDEYEEPALAEGFVCARVYENTYDQRTGRGGFVLKREIVPEQPAAANGVGDALTT